MAEDKKKINGDTLAADSKKKPNGEVSAAVASKSASKWAEKFSKLRILCTELNNDPTGAQDYEKTFEQNVTLNAELKRRTEEISSLKKQHNDEIDVTKIQYTEEINSLKTQVAELERLGTRNLQDFAKAFAAKDSQLKDAESCKQVLATTQHKLDEAKKTIKKLEAENKQLETKAREVELAKKRTERKVVEIEAECSRLKASLNSAETKIKFYCEDQLVAWNLEEKAAKFEDFAERCHHMVMECFEPCEAPPKDISSLMTYIQASPGRHMRLPVTNYTTVSARLMRCAAAELVIANVLVDYIFTDIWLAGRSDWQKEQKAVAATIELLLVKDPQRASLLRCQLLEEYPSNQSLLAVVRQTAYDTICDVLDDLLPAGGPRDAFHAKLDNLLQFAMRLWEPMQRSRDRVSASLSFGTHELERDEDAYPDYDGPNGQQAQRTTGRSDNDEAQPVLVLFPLICTEEHIICHPRALWSDQGAFIDAKNKAEGHRLSMTGTLDSGRPSVPKRRMSVTGRGAVSPTSAMPPAAALNGPPDGASRHPMSNRGNANGTKAPGRVS